MKYQVHKLTPAIRKPGIVYHFHGESKRPCYCRAGTDAAFSQALASVPVQVLKEGK